MSRLSISSSFLVYCHLRCSLDGNLVKSCTDAVQMLCRNVSFDAFLIKDRSFMVKLDRPPALVKAANHDWDCQILKAMPGLHSLRQPCRNSSIEYQQEHFNDMNDFFSLPRSSVVQRGLKIPVRLFMR